MTNIITSLKIESRLLIIAGVMAASMLAFLPSISHAATFAFVNHSGEVSTVVANTSGAAISTAFNISLHSGVLLLLSQSDNNIVGDSVSGM